MEAKGASQSKGATQKSQSKGAKSKVESLLELQRMALMRDFLFGERTHDKSVYFEPKLGPGHHVHGAPAPALPACSSRWGWRPTPAPTNFQPPSGGVATLGGLGELRLRSDLYLRHATSTNDGRRDEGQLAAAGREGQQGRRRPGVSTGADAGDLAHLQQQEQARRRQAGAGQSQR